MNKFLQNITFRNKKKLKMKQSYSNEIECINKSLPSKKFEFFLALSANSTKYLKKKHSIFI